VGPHHCVLVLKGWLQCRWRHSLHKQSHTEDKGKQVQVALGKILSQHKKEINYSKNNHSLEQPAQGHGRVSIAEDFQDAISSKLPFPQKAEPDDLIRIE